LHTAIDDLESFLWVFLWTILHIFCDREVISDTGTRWLAKLTDDAIPDQLADSKIAFIYQEARLPEWAAEYKDLRPFGHLIYNMCQIAKDACEELQAFGRQLLALNAADMHSLCKKYYARYITALLDASTELPDSWGYLEE
jgi:hypothetical protein